MRSRPRRRYRLRGAAALVTAVLEASLTVPPATAVPPSEDACHTTADVMPRGDCGPFHQVFAEDFDGDVVPLGSFSDCDHDADTPNAHCGGLTGSYRADWWAYPRGWYDTAHPRNHSNGNNRVLGVSTGPTTPCGSAPPRTATAVCTSACTVRRPGATSMSRPSYRAG